MRNILLLFLSIFTSFLLVEIALRYAIFPWIGRGITTVVPIVFSKHGYWTNPNSGTTRQQLGKRVVYYHYFSPHLRDTPIQPQSIPILVLGDSFTFGWLLSWDDTYIHHLQVNLDNTFGKHKYQLLNAATGGWGTADQLAYLEEYGSRLLPQFILIFLSTDDIGRSLKRNIYKLTDLKSFELNENYHSPIHHPKIKECLTNNWFIKHSSFIQLICHGAYSLYSFFFHIHNQPYYVFQSNKIVIPKEAGLNFRDDDVIHYGNALFHRINQWCIAHHSKLLIVTTGFNSFFPEGVHEPTKVFLSQAPDFFKKENINYYDIAPCFKKEADGKDIQISFDFHPNELGAKIIADLSWPWIKEQLKK